MSLSSACGITVTKSGFVAVSPSFSKVCLLFGWSFHVRSIRVLAGSSRFPAHMLCGVTGILDRTHHACTEPALLRGLHELWSRDSCREAPILHMSWEDVARRGHLVSKPNSPDLSMNPLCLLKQCPCQASSRFRFLFRDTTSSIKIARPCKTIIRTLLGGGHCK